MIKIFRAFHGGYTPDQNKLASMGYLSVRNLRPFINVKTANQGFGQIKGTTKKVGANYSPVPVCCFKRSTRELLWETKSKSDGTYRIGNIAKELECFVVAFDPNNQYNAVIQDKVIAK